MVHALLKFDTEQVPVFFSLLPFGADALPVLKMAKDIAALFPVRNLEMLPLLEHGILPSRRAAYPDNFRISKQMGV